MSSGNLRFSEPFHKVLEVENANPILIGTAGDVGETQQILKRTIQSINIRKVMGNEDLTLMPEELAEELSSFCWDLQNLRIYSEWKGAGFIVGGFNVYLKQAKLFMVDQSGANVPVNRFCCDGSGSQLALGILNEFYSPDLPKADALKMIYQALRSASTSDIYSGSGLEIFFISNTGEKEMFLEPEELEAEKEIKSEKKEEEKPKET